MDWECRVCGEQIFISDPKNIFDKENSGILQRIKQLTGLALVFSENLPMHICSCCLLDLNQAVVFRERCLRTQRHLYMKTAKSLDAETKWGAQDPLDEHVLPTEPSGAEDKKSQVLCASDAKEVKKIVPNPRSDYPRVVVKRYRMPVATTTSPHSETQSHSRNTSAKVKAEADLRDKPGPPKKKRRKRIPCPEKKYVCDQCGWAFNDLSNMKDHKLRHSEKQFACDECGSYFYTSRQLKMHVRVKHKGEKPFLCKYCGMAFNNSPSRCRHERRYHSNDLPYVCNLCSKRFVSKVGLTKHALLHKGGGNGKHYCEICDKEFKEAIFLRGHYLTKYHRTRASIYDACEYEETDNEIDFDFTESIINE
ncbi:transcription factor Ouib-like [Drosophila miranda]|uniref:transcription factor Ouib-like n=1 Tax=Drosophila miranda TaxID=7229 RepID=UPI0007E703DB|nr:transcription factor Ouib-like [Drosophila miranda]